MLSVDARDVTLSIILDGQMIETLSLDSALRLPLFVPERELQDAEVFLQKCETRRELDTEKSETDRQMMRKVMQFLEAHDRVLGPDLVGGGTYAEAVFEDFLCLYPISGHSYAGQGASFELVAGISESLLEELGEIPELPTHFVKDARICAEAFAVPLRGVAPARRSRAFKQTRHIVLILTHGPLLPELGRCYIQNVLNCRTLGLPTLASDEYLSSVQIFACAEMEILSLDEHSIVNRLGGSSTMPDARTTRIL